MIESMTKILFLLINISAFSLFGQETNRERLDWNLNKTVGAYQTVGKTSPAWDEPAKCALTEYASLRPDSPSAEDPYREQIIASNCDTAIKAGCDDPLVR
jgi:hypothetical protein